VRQVCKFIYWVADLRVARRFDKLLCCRFCWLCCHYTNVWSMIFWWFYKLFSKKDY